MLKDGWKLIFAVIAVCTILSWGRCADAAERPQPTREEYQAQYDNAVKLADMLRESPYLLHNKLYTAEQEVELQAWVDSACGGLTSDREKARALLACIGNSLEPGACYELNGWDTLCDGENEQLNTSGEPVAKKNAVNEEVYCFTFYDVCRLAGIPCFILEDYRGSLSDYRYIAMVYAETVSGTGKEWYFVDVAAEDGQLIKREDAYDRLGTDIYPMNLVLDYDKMMYAMNAISLSRGGVVKDKNAPRLIYDSATDTVKAYFKNGTLANGEQYMRTEVKVGEDGEAPSGWIETKRYSSGTMETYISYAVCGVFLRGRVEKDGKEYNLQAGFYDNILYHEKTGSEPESEEHREFVSAYQKKLEDKAIKYAGALLEDKNYVWNDTNFNAEDEKLIREAVNTALDWEYIHDEEGSLILTAFESAGISLSEEDPANLSDKAKAQAILLYIKRNVKSVDHGAANVNSAYVLKAGEGTCDGISLLYRDMCVMAGLPCFRLACSLNMDIGDSLFVDHGDNLVKAGDEWFFCDPMNSGILGKAGCFQHAFIEGYETMDKTMIYLDCEAVRKDNYYKWGGETILLLDYYDFDSEGKLGIYRRNRFGEPVVIESETDENGRYVMENGLHTDDIPEMNEDGSAEIVTRYAYYYQNRRKLQGKKNINGTEYTFNQGNEEHAYYHRLQEVSRRYVISRLTFQPLEDQPYDEAGACPIPEIRHGDKKLEYGKDFRIVEYRHNKELTTYADASYKVEGIGDYMGEATRYFKVVQADISGREVKLSQTSFTWRPDTKYYKPEVDLGLNSQDYSVAYYDFDKIGRARAVITGKRNYKGSVTKEYDIKPCVWNEKEFQILGDNMELLQSQEFGYNFSPVTAGAKVYWYDENGKRYCLSEANDYDITYSGTDRPGTAAVTATGKGKYQGSLTCTYEITPYILWDDAIRAEYTTAVYNGKVQKPTVVVKGENLAEGKDYFVSYEKKEGGVYQEAEPKEAGEYRIVFRVTDQIIIKKTDALAGDGSDRYYISYVIHADKEDGSGTEGSTGGSNSGTGDAGSGTGSNTGGSSGGNGSTSGGIPGTEDSGIKAEDSKNVSVSGSSADKIKKLKLTSKKKAIKISWSKVRGAKGYQIQISRYKNFKKAKTINVKKKKRSYTARKLKSRKKYYIRVRVYKGTTGKGKNKRAVYGKWKKASRKTK